MSFGSGGSFSGFGQQNQQQSTFGSGGFGTTTGTSSGFGTGTGGFGATQTTGGGLFGSTSGTGTGFGGTSGGFGASTTTGGGFGAAKPAFGTATTTGGGGLFGSSTTTAGGSGFGGAGGAGGFGTTASSSTPFGGGGTSLFGGSKPSTFGTGATTTTGTGSSLFGGGGFGGGGTSTGFGATTNPGIGTNVGDPPGTATVQFQPFVEKEANSSTNQQNSFQNILFMDNYKKWSAEELRLADYNQGRKHGSAGGSSGFGLSSGFGSGTGFGGATSQPSGFGGSGTTGGGLFGGAQQQPSTGFGAQASTTGAFGSGGGGLFGSKPATGGGLFGGGGTSQPAQTGGLFGSTTGTGFGGAAATGTGFGSTATGGGGLFGSSATPAKPAGFSFPTAGAQQPATGFGTATGGGAFGASTGTGAATGGLFGTGTQQQTGGGLFGGTAQQPAATGFGTSTGGFGAQPQQQQQQQQTGGLFGQQAQKPAGGLFGSQPATGTTGGGLFGAATSTNPFGAAATTQQGGGLFGAKPAATGGLFGTGAAIQQPAAGGGLFGGLSQAAQPQQQQQQQGSLFGGLNPAAQQKPSLFGASTAATGGGLFGQQPAQGGGGLFGASLTQQPQAQAGGSLFSGSLGQQSTPQSLTASINDVTAYGTPSLFQGLGGNEVQNPGPLATPLSGSKMKTSRRSSILPMYKLQPNSASKFVTPQKRGYGFSYSTFGTPTSPSSVASTPGALGQSLLGGSLSRPLGKSISSSNLRRSFAPDESILSPGAFSASSGGRYYGSTGSFKKLTINRDIRTDLFSTPSKDKQQQQQQQPPVDARKLSKRVSFDTSVAAIENGEQGSSRQSPNTSTSSAPADLGFIRASGRANGVNGTGSSASDSPPEMEQVKGNELAIVHEEGSPATQIKPAPGRGASGEAGDYWMSPSKQDIDAMNRQQRAAVPNLTVGRENVGQIRFRVPVDLVNISVDEIPGGIVELQTRSCTVYPVAAKKPPVGKGLNVPAEITLENSWPRTGASDKSNNRIKKHIERLKQIENTEFVNYDTETGVWTFTVEHFTTYGLDYDDEETDAEVPAVDAHEERDEDTPSVPTHQRATVASPDIEIDPDDTFEFRRKRQALPGAFDPEEASDYDDDYSQQQQQQQQQSQSFLSKRSAEPAAHAVVPLAVEEDEEMGIEDDVSENEEMATPSQQHLPAERQPDSPFLSVIAAAQEKPAGILRARMQAIKESATPVKLQVAGGDDWMDMLQRTISPQKRDRAALKALNEVGASQSFKQSTTQDKTAVPRARVLSDGRGFATSIDLMNSLFEKAKTPAVAPQNIAPATGFPKWPYKRQNKVDEDEANMAPLERSFHDSFKPRWAPDGTCIYATSNPRSDLIGSLAADDGPTLNRINVFSRRDFGAEDPLDGIVDHRDLVDINLVDGVPSVSTQRVAHVKAFSSFRENSLAQKSSTMSSLSKRLGSYEQSVWELASILFDPIDAHSGLSESRARREKLAKFWTALVQDTVTKSADETYPLEEKAIVYLSGRRVPEACRMLADSKNLKLAALVSQIGTSDAFKKDMREQVEEWYQGEVLSEFSLPHRVLYSLLGGSVAVCDGKKGVGIENRMQSIVISQRYGLDWKQAFGLRLWYGIAAKDDIATAVDNFLEDVEQGRVSPPRPWYVEEQQQRVEEAQWADAARESREDLLWGLLKFFAGRTRLEDILQPENSQPAPFNFRLCWQLSQVLTAAAAGKAARLSPNSLDALTVSYATEVVNHGREGNWIAAIWVLLHLTSPASRVRAIQDVLGHNAGSLFSTAAKEHNFYERLVKDLKIPTAWVWQAAALHWRNKQGQSSLEAQCLLKASAFVDAHRIFVKELAPQAIIEGNYAEISSMLAKFKPHRHAIPDWSLGGEVYSNFIELHAHRLRGGHAAPVPAPLVDTLTSSLPAMYKRAQDSNTTEVAAITEMADEVAKATMELGRQGRVDSSKVSRLPLTEDRHLRYSTDLALSYYREAMVTRG